MTRADLKRWQPQLYKAFSHLVQSGRMGHAYLFAGASGQLEMALFLAQSQYCETPEAGLPCETCRPCRLIAQGEFSDVRLLAPTNQIIKTDLVREILQEFAQSGFETDHQVLIIQEADKLHLNGANSLLKFIEEPQSNIRVFLLTDREDSILPTIRSRCQVFHFPKNRAVMIEDLEKEGLLKTQAQLLSDLCPTVEDAVALGKSTHFQDLLKVCEQWTMQVLEGQAKAYLTVAKMAYLVQDKSEQGQVFDLLTLLLAKELPAKSAQEALVALLKAKTMWQANVSFQNALEFMIVS
ncbi:DNA polymerase III subunit delta' [Streptococcus ovuberis]|uniref:DNA polymerase III subunit delta n=1 Tax=Streptococcus ovuberis TaxID=1936207 RepID=A0A7X6MY99_9STRE|nr:DNA polymerase III subunit delta' [Streptococcus ovuberis]NKZ19601.1 DNA polymerase III subunit delta' [Streptococcus ovuberis]